MSEEAASRGLDQLPIQVRALVTSRAELEERCIVAPSEDVGATTAELRADTLRAVEAADPIILATKSEPRWFAVIATLDATPAGLSSAAAFAKMAQERARELGQDDIPEPQIWRTKISNNYAVTLGGPTDSETAQIHVNAARNTAIALDAFRQVDREWSIVNPGAAAKDAPPLAGFTVYVHLGPSVNDRGLRDALFKLLTGLGADIGGFDGQEDKVGGAGVDFEEGSATAEAAANTIADALDEIDRNAAPRPQRAIARPSIIGLWL